MSLFLVLLLAIYNKIYYTNKKGYSFQFFLKEGKMQKKMKKSPFERAWGTTPKKEIVRLSLAIVGTLSILAIALGLMKL